MDEEMVLCAASAYERKFYLNPEFNSLPEEVKQELQIMCVLYTADVGGILMVVYDENGNLELKVDHKEDDFTFDEEKTAMIFDTHAHYDDEQFDADREALLSGMKAGGVGMIVDAAATVASWDKILELTEKYPFLYGSVGVHPDEVGDLNEENFARMSELADRKKIVAIGEIGLDYYWDKEGHDLQKYWFIRQLELAGEKKLPVMIHSREAAADTMEIMKKYGKDRNGVIHCYSYSPEMAQEYVKMGYFIGVGGVVTFKNAKKLKETVQEIPLESIVLETDCPYLAPEPFRGKRNCSLYISYVAEKIAELKGISAEEVIRQTEENAKQLYQIDESRLLKEQVIE